jgi:hypothetical protein
VLLEADFYGSNSVPVTRKRVSQVGATPLHVLRNNDKNNLQFSNNDCTKEIISSIAKAIVPDEVFSFPFHFCVYSFLQNNFPR